MIAARATFHTRAAAPPHQLSRHPYDPRSPPTAGFPSSIRSATHCEREGGSVEELRQLRVGCMRGWAAGRDYLERKGHGADNVFEFSEDDGGAELERGLNIAGGRPINASQPRGVEVIFVDGSFAPAVLAAHPDWYSMKTVDDYAGGYGRCF